MTTESRVEEANKAMAAIADDMLALEQERRERLREIWQPVAHALIDNALTGPGGAGPVASDPHFVGVTCDTRREVFLDKAISSSGLVYRKFRIAKAGQKISWF